KEREQRIDQYNEVEDDIQGEDYDVTLDEDNVVFQAFEMTPRTMMGSQYYSLVSETAKRLKEKRESRAFMLKASIILTKERISNVLLSKLCEQSISLDRLHGVDHYVAGVQRMVQQQQELTSKQLTGQVFNQNISNSGNFFTKTYAITCMEWHPRNGNIIAVSYQPLLTIGNPVNARTSQKESSRCNREYVWNVKENKKEQDLDSYITNLYGSGQNSSDVISQISNIADEDVDTFADPIIIVWDIYSLSKPICLVKLPEYDVITAMNWSSSHTNALYAGTTRGNTILIDISIAIRTSPFNEEEISKYYQQAKQGKRIKDKTGEILSTNIRSSTFTSLSKLSPSIIARTTPTAKTVQGEIIALRAGTELDESMVVVVDREGKSVKWQGELMKAISTFDLNPPSFQPSSTSNIPNSNSLPSLSQLSGQNQITPSHTIQQTPYTQRASNIQQTPSLTTNDIQNTFIQTQITPSINQFRDSGYSRLPQFTTCAFFGSNSSFCLLGAENGSVFQAKESNISILVRSKDSPSSNSEAHLPLPITSLHIHPYTHRPLIAAGYAILAQSQTSKLKQGGLKSGNSGMSYQQQLPFIFASSCFDGSVCVWRAPPLTEDSVKSASVIRSPQLVCNKIETHSPATVVQWSPSNPNLLAVGSEDGIITLWDVLSASNEPIVSKKVVSTSDGCSIMSMKWCSNGRLIAVGTSEGALFFFQVGRRRALLNAKTQEENYLQLLGFTPGM
ncbi:MAG: hypothetical protein EZS28_029986, partial [Streblomastix strix]